MDHAEKSERNVKMSLRVPIGTLFFINLKKYYVISIDIFRNIIYNKSINKDEIKKGGAK